MHRFYVEDGSMAGGTARLTPEDARHALRVLRLQPGDACEAFAGGCRYGAVLDAVSGDEVTLRILAEMPSTEPKLRVTLYQGLPKADKMELIVQKCVELGAAQIVPVAMSRSIVKLNGKDAEKKRDRWQKIAHEACKQSCRCLEPQVEVPISGQELLRRLPRHELALVPWEDARCLTLKAVRASHADALDAAIIIGPEGGMSAEEVGQMQALGALPITLGPRILRTETAGFCTLAGMMCLWDEWG